MKKRILLSLVSFFMMTAMWASLVDAYKITASADGNGKTYGTATLTLSMDNRNAIAIWKCTVVLPQGVTYVDGSAAIVEGRYPEAYGTPELKATVNEDGSVTLECGPAESADEGVTLTGTAGAVATIEVAIAGGEGGAVVGDNIVAVKDGTFFEGDGTKREDEKVREYTWTIDEGEAPAKKGDVNMDGEVTIADLIAVLNKMAGGEVAGNADVNEDGEVTIADAVGVLNIMAAQ